MGGSVAVTVREESGREHRMCRWTNVLPWFVNNMKLVNKDPTHVAAYLKQWNEMRADYLKHQQDENFESPMTPCYAPYSTLAPHGYGLVVIDMQKNRILSSQGYSYLGDIDSIAVASDMSSVSPGVHKMVIGGKQPARRGLKAFHDDADGNAYRFREFLEAGRISEAKGNNNSISMEGKSLDDTIEIIKNDHKHSLHFPIDMSPFKIKTYYEYDSDSAIEMRQDIEQLGFSLTDEENKIWDEWIQHNRRED